MRKDKRRIKIDLRDPVQVKLYEELKRAQEAFHVEAACLDAPVVAEANAKETIKQRDRRDRWKAQQLQHEEAVRMRPPQDNTFQPWNRALRVRPVIGQANVIVNGVQIPIEDHDHDEPEVLRAFIGNMGVARQGQPVREEVRVGVRLDDVVIHEDELPIVEF